MINKLKQYFSEQEIKNSLLSNPFSFKSELDLAYFCITKNERKTHFFCIFLPGIWVFGKTPGIPVKWEGL